MDELIPVKISELPRTAFLNPSDLFLVFRNGATTVSDFEGLTEGDLLIMVQESQTRAITFENMNAQLSAVPTPPPVVADLTLMTTGSDTQETYSTGFANEAYKI